MKTAVLGLIVLLVGVWPVGETLGSDLDLVRSRYLEWVLQADDTDYSNPHIQTRYKNGIRITRRVIDKLDKDFDLTTDAGLYDTRKTGPDQQEVEYLVKTALPILALAYQLQGDPASPNPYYQNAEVRARILQIFDRLHARGFRQPMLMPWKAHQVDGDPTGKAVIVDFQLRTAGYPLATFLMRQELQEQGQLERNLDTCREILSHDDKFGDPGALKQNADGIRVVIHNALPYALAANDTERLRHFAKQVDRSAMPESNAADTIKPDGLGFHHRGAYVSGYAGYAIAQSAFAAWLCRDTEFACQPETIAHLTKAIETVQIVSAKYDVPPSLSGRLSNITVIPHIMLGFGYLADIDHPRQEDCREILAYLADADYMKSRHAERSFLPQRNEVPPGPGAIASFLKIRRKASRPVQGAAPTGHWALNYGPISIHRRDDWMVSVKGHSRYWWAFERSLVDARMTDRLENVLGFHDGSASIRIYSQGSPISAEASGYVEAGWDPCLIPGATTRLIPPTELIAMDQAHRGKRALQRPFAKSAFSGGVSLGGRHGLFAMNYQEVAPDQREKPLSAVKAMFFFENQIVVVSDKIRNGDGRYPAVTTLYQTHLPSENTETWVQGNPITGIGRKEIVTSGRSLTLMDPVGNGYYLPRADRVVIRRDKQVSLDDSATSETEGDFATAWFDHGTQPEHVYCEYVVLVDSSPDELAAFAKKARATYSVINRNSRGIIVEHHELGLTGYALPMANETIPNGSIERVSAPCLAMIETHGENQISMSVCNPDLGWKEGVRYQYKNRDGSSPPPTEPVPTPVTLWLRGEWKLSQSHDEVQVLKPADGVTEVRVQASDARSIEFLLEGG